MVDAVASSLAGLHAVSSRMAMASSRIANASTPAQPDPVTGMVPSSNGISLDEEVVNVKLAELSYTANARVIQVKLNIEKELIDILA